MAATLPPAFQQRSNVSGPTLAPPWLCGYNTNGEKYLYTFGLGLDALLEKMNEAMLAKCPGLADDSAIPFQAADRLFVQGPAESNPSFVARLRGAFDAWAIAGSRHAVMQQLQGYLTDLQPGINADAPIMRIVGGNLDLTTWDSLYNYNVQGDRPAHQTVTPANWEWDGELEPWRAWLVLYMHLVATGQSGTAGSVTTTGGSGVPGVTSGFVGLSLDTTDLTVANVQDYITITGASNPSNNGTFQIVDVVSSSVCIIANPDAVAADFPVTWSIGRYPYIAPAPVWGSQGFVWGSSYTWGVDCSPNVIVSIRQILQRWKSSSTYYPNIIIAFGNNDGTAGEDFSPLSSPGSGNPDDTWGDIGKNVAGCWVPAKDGVNIFTAFCDGTGRAVSCYEKNQT